MSQQSLFPHHLVACAVAHSHHVHATLRMVEAAAVGIVVALDSGAAGIGVVDTRPEVVVEVHYTALRLITLHGLCTDGDRRIEHD